MSVILTSDHLRIVRQLKRRAILVHLCGVLLVAGLFLIGWAHDLDRRIILASYETIRSERDLIILKQELLQVLRKRPLTIGAAIDIMEAVSNQRSIPVPIILAILEQESQFDPKAVSPKGARGNGQLMPIVWKQYGNGTNIHDPLSNITASISYLSDLYKQFGTWKRTFRAYYAGPEHADDKRMDGYANAVLKRAQRYSLILEE
jgi:soluble lytic murein transglycosylase-like protein